MPRFVTVEEAISHLRLDLTLEDSPPDPDQERLEAKLDEAEAVILDYLKVIDDSPEWEPSAAKLPVVQAAVKLALSALWEDAEGTGDGDYLRMDGAIARLLIRMRDPAVA
jgi:hypothetical protein